VYTASGFLNSLVFNDEIDAYKGWTLFAIFVSILILIGGVVLLTLKKPDPVPANSTALGTPSRARTKASDEEAGDERDLEALHTSGPGQREEVVWQIGDADDDSDDERGAGTGTSQIRPDLNRRRSGSGSLRARANSHIAPKHQGEEGRGLMGAHDEEDEHDEADHRRSPVQSLHKRDDGSDEEFGGWKQATPTGSPRARR
ncbi:hypothetical protein FRC08_000387, partial [Ceratobasidium sp. 394]